MSLDMAIVIMLFTLQKEEDEEAYILSAWLRPAYSV